MSQNENLKSYRSVILSIVIGLVPILPGLYLYWLIDHFIDIKPPRDLSQILFTGSAAALSILLAAATFLFDRLRKGSVSALDEATVKPIAVLDKKDSNPEEKKNAIDELYILRTSAEYPKSIASVIIRSLFLLVLSLTVSAADFFAGYTYAIEIALIAFILFLINIAYVMFKILSDTLRDITESVKYINDSIKKYESSEKRNIEPLPDITLLSRFSGNKRNRFRRFVTKQRRFRRFVSWVNRAENVRYLILLSILIMITALILSYLSFSILKLISIPPVSIMCFLI